MRAALIMALVAVLASTPACAMFDTSTEIETGADARRLAKLHERISGVTVKVLVMVETEKTIVSMHGSGVIVGRSGTTYALVTNLHVIDTSGIVPPPVNIYYNIENPKTGNVSAEVVATDSRRDLACLTFECREELEVAQVVTAEPPLLTDVYHYGYGGLWYKGAFATKGVFSSKSRIWPALPCAWTVTSSVWYGCSGGGVFTADGRLMGITSIIDIERSVCLPWLVGVVPYHELEKFMKNTTFSRETIAGRK